MKLFIAFSFSLFLSQLALANPTSLEAKKVAGARHITIPVFGGGEPINTVSIKSCSFINLDNEDGTSDFAVMTKYRGLGFRVVDKNFHFSEIPTFIEISKKSIALKSEILKMVSTMKNNSVKKIYKDKVGTNRETIVEIAKDTKVASEFSNSLTFFRYTESDSALLRDYKFITFYFNKDFSKVNFLRINQGNWGVDCFF
ncbi:MAG: hypothetical protein U0T83_01435 [Bacteriovoracaceae bacterium]